MKSEDRLDILEQKVDALHEAVEKLIELMDEKPREDQFAVAAARFRKAAG